MTAPDPSPRDERALHRALDALDEAATVAELADLVRLPSVGGSPEEAEVQHRLAAAMTDAGLATDLWELDLDALGAQPDFPGVEVARTEAWGLVGSTPPADDGPTLILQGHADVVPPGEPSRWAGSPWSGELRDGEVHGRGSADMKGGLVACLAVARTLAAAGIRLRGRLVLHSVVGEEDGGLGAYATLARGHTGDAAVIAEPTSLTLVPATAGALTFRLTVRGLAAHAGSRTEGLSALRLLEPVNAALDALEADRNADPGPLFADHPLPYAISLGRVVAGDWPSTVPELLVAEGRLGVRLGEDPAEARLALTEALAAAGAGHPWLQDHPVEVEWFGGQFAPGALPLGAPLLGQLTAAHEAVHLTRPGVRAVPYGSDLRLYAAAGIPTLHYGPGDVRRAHAPDEAVPVAEVLACARTLLAWTIRTCGTR